MKLESMSFKPHLAVVGFLDLLGFSSDIMSVENDPSHLVGRRIKFDIMKELASKFAIDRCNLTATMQWASDSCVAYSMVQPLSDREEGSKHIVESLRQVAMSIGLTQCIFACEEYFSRGGIAIGTLVSESGSEPFGPGIVRAVEIEKMLADEPQVLVSGVLAGPALGLQVPVNGRKIFHLDMPLPSLDYLSFAELASDFGDPRHLLGWHAQRVHWLMELAYCEPRFAKKANWLLFYHNWHIQDRGRYENLIVRLPEAKVDS
jgi:hypothetical protein